MQSSKKLIELIKESQNQGTSPIDTQAEVVRIEEGTAWVHLPGGIDETPVQRTIDAKPGDTVQVRIADGSAWIVGNATAPPTDDKEVLRVEQKLDYNIEIINQTTEALQERLDNIAGDDNQYFWHQETGTDTGSHITEIPKEDFIQNPRGFNILIRSIGLAIRNALDELAQFTSSLIRLGKAGEGRIEIAQNQIGLYNADGTLRAYLKTEQYFDAFELVADNDNSMKRAGLTAKKEFSQTDHTKGQAFVELIDSGSSDAEGTWHDTAELSPIALQIRDDHGSDGELIATRNKIQIEKGNATDGLYRTYISDQELSLLNRTPRTTATDKTIIKRGEIDLLGSSEGPEAGTPVAIIYLQSDASAANPAYIKCYSVDGNSRNLLIKPTGNFIAGGGEYAENRYNLDLAGSTGERAFLGADSEVLIESNGNTIANRRTWRFRTDGQVEAPNGGVLARSDNATKSAMIWGNSTNRVAVMAQDTNDNDVRLLAKNSYLQLYDNTNSAALWNLHPNRYYEGQASASSTALPADAQTKVALSGLYAGENPNNDFFEISGGGIKVKTAGRYRITAGAYISGTGAHGVYVFQGTGTTLATSTEILGCYLSTAITGGISCGPKIVQAAANDIFLLAARSQGAGTCAKNNATYLLIEKLS